MENDEIIIESLKKIDLYKRKIEKEIQKKKKVLDKKKKNKLFIDDIDSLYVILSIIATIAGFTYVGRFMFNELFSLKTLFVLLGSYVSIPVLYYVLDIPLEIYRQHLEESIKKCEKEMEPYISVLCKLYKASIKLDNVLINECSNSDLLQLRKEDLLDENKIIRYQYDKYSEIEEQNKEIEYLKNLKFDYNDLNKKYTNKLLHINRVNKLEERKEENLQTNCLSFQTCSQAQSDIKVRSKKLQA